MKSQQRSRAALQSIMHAAGSLDYYRTTDCWRLVLYFIVLLFALPCSDWFSDAPAAQAEVIFHRRDHRDQGVYASDRRHTYHVQSQHEAMVCKNLHIICFCIRSTHSKICILYAFVYIKTSKTMHIICFCQIKQ